LPGRRVANVGSFAYFVGKPTRKRSEAATAHTGGRWWQFKQKQMRRYILIILISLFSLSVYSIDSIDSSRYIHASNALKNLSINQLVKYLRIGAKSDKKEVETFFYWIAQNIEYDYDLKDKVGTTYEDVTIDSVLIKKRTICAGYSNLLYEMCKLAKIECVIINGIAQNYLDYQIDSTNHAWNAVKISDSWYLIDVTWGSGASSIGREEYIKRIDTKYLFADPYFLIIDHFPNDTKWQLLNKPITLRQFQSVEWKEKRFRKFNNLLDDEDYKNHLQIMKNNGWE
jgi:transglutaminase/protease-like cytokinesis protein 3